MERFRAFGAARWGDSENWESFSEEAGDPQVFMSRRR